MSEINVEKEALVITSDEKLISSLVGERSEYFTFRIDQTFERIDEAIDAVVYDIDIASGDLAQAKVDVLAIKNAAPELPLIVVGQSEQSNLLFKEGRVSALIDRSVTKPIASRQLDLAMHVAISAKETNSPTISNSGSAENNGLLSRLFGVLILFGIVAYLSYPVLTGQDEQLPLSKAESTLFEHESEGHAEGDLKGLENSHDIQQLSELAANAFNKGNLVLPVKENALAYYQQILDIDAYNQEAYQGFQKTVNQIREDFPRVIKYGDLDTGARIVEVLTEVDPFNKNNAEIILELKNAQARQVVRSIDKQVSIAAGSEWETNNVIEQGADSKGVESSSVDQQTILSEDSSNESHGLAGSVESTKAKGPKFSSNTRASSSTQALPTRVIVSSANSTVPSAPLAKGNISNQSSNVLSVVPHKIVNRVEPKYPRKAYNLDIEGWVELSFQVDTNGSAINIEVVNAEPRKIFNKSSVEALEKWSFSPARDSESGVAVLSEKASTRFNYSIGNL